MHEAANLLSIALDSIFVNNILLAAFLGTCSFLSCSENIKTATGLGVAVTGVLTLTAPANWLVYHKILKSGGLSWLGEGFIDVDMNFLSFITFIAVIAALVQILEMLMEKMTPALYTALGIFLPLITVNCAVLGVALFLVERKYDLVETTVYGFSSGIGWSMAIIGLAAIRKKLKYSNVPHGLRGMGITFITAGLMSMAFMCFSGIPLSRLFGN